MAGRDVSFGLNSTSRIRIVPGPILEQFPDFAGAVNLEIKLARWFRALARPGYAPELRIPVVIVRISFADPNLQMQSWVHAGPILLVQVVVEHRSWDQNTRANTAVGIRCSAKYTTTVIAPDGLIYLHLTFRLRARPLTANFRSIEVKGAPRQRYTSNPHS